VDRRGLEVDGTGRAFPRLCGWEVG
jgi:hypothetical protein